MNIALFTDCYPPTKNGVVTVVVQLKKILEEMGHHVVVVTVGRGKPGCEDNEKNVYRTRCIVLPHDETQFFAIPNISDIIRFLKQHKIQIIHSHTEFAIGLTAARVGRLLNIPVIASTHTMWELYYRHYLKLLFWLPKNIVRWVIRLLYKPYYSLINVSQKAHDYYKKPFMIPNTPSTIIPNAIDSKKFISHECSAEEKDALRKKLKIDEKDKVVLYVGRVVEEKRMDELLEVLKRVADKRENTKVLFVGDGARLEKLKKNVTESGYESKILFTGFINWTELSGYYALGNVFVTASLSEMHSMTILEALNLGIPCVCRYDTSFSDTIFDGVNGYFAASDEEMDEKILKVLNDDSLAEKMSKNALETAKHFTLDVHGKKTVAYYQAVLDHYPQPVTDEILQSAVAGACDK